MSYIDLNDLYFFAQSVEAGGFSAAARKLGIPKATLSRRLAKLEERLGVKLIHRNTRLFQPTYIGELYYQYCASITAEAESAEHIIKQYSHEPQGVIKLSCPVEILELYVNDMLVEFTHRYPNVRLDVWGINRYVDVVAEGRDFAIRAKTFPLPDSDMVVRQLMQCPQLLVASPDLVAEPICDLGGLNAYPSLSNQTEGLHQWHFRHRKDGTRSLFYQPRIISRNLNLLKKAALAGQGVVMLPLTVIAGELQAGRLCPVLSDDWLPENDTVHAVYPSRHGMLPSVSKLLDFLAERFAELDMPVPIEGV